MTRDATRASSNVEARMTGALWLLAVLLGLLRMRSYLPHGRFWAEEGRYFFTDILAIDGPGALIYLFNHHLEAVTNLVVWLSTQVPLAHAPLVTTLGSFVLQLLPLGWLIHQRAALGLGTARVAVFVLLAACIPQSREIWANSINLHFHFALLAGLILATPPGSRVQRFTARSLLVTAGLSGVPANALAPFFVWKAIRSRQREAVLQAAILCSTAILQAGLLGCYGLPEHRDTSVAPDLIAAALFAQSVLSPWLPHALARVILRTVADAPVLMACVMLLIVALAGGALLHRGRKRGDMTPLLVACAGLGLTMVCIVGALGDKSALISLQDGGRYFYAGNLLLLLAVLMSWPPLETRRSQVWCTVWLLLLAPGLGKTYRGVAWPDALHEAASSGATTIRIWPEGWTMPLPPSRSDK